MVRNIDPELRKKAILTATINKYIQGALPIASEDIAREFDLSSATIRNIFAELEDDGYLTHPYTSAGRIPTDKGYRYYVDFLISGIFSSSPSKRSLSEERERIVKEYKGEIKKFEDALEETSEVISTITHYPGIVSFLKWQDRFFYCGLTCILEQPEFQDFKKLSLLIKVIEEKQHLLEIINRDFSEKVKVYIGGESGWPEMEGCSLVVSTYHIRKKPLGKLAVLGPLRMEYEQIIPRLESISDVLTGLLDNI